MKSTNNTTMKKAIATAVAALVLSTSMLLTGCGEPGSTTPETQQETTAKVEKETNTSSQTAEKNNDSGLTSDTSKTNDKANGSTSEKTADSKSSDNKDSASNKSSDANNTNSNKPESKQNNNSKPNSNSNNNSKPNNTDSHAGKTYHEAVYKTVHHDAEYKDVYVVDQKASSYEEPIYETRVYTICHVCGAEFDTSYDSSAFFAHNKAHAMAGEGGGYHNEVREIQTGSKTVNVPEEGHYEKKVVKDAWDEKVIVKEAGWY